MMMTMAVPMAMTMVMVVLTGTLRAHRLAPLAVVRFRSRSFGGSALHVVHLVIQFRLAQILGGHGDLCSGR